MHAALALMLLSLAPADPDLDALGGTWRIASMVSDGEERPIEEIKHWTATYEGNRLTLRAGVEVRRRSIVTIDPSRSPKAINTWDQGGPFDDQTLAGIYEIEGDTLRLCFARPGEPRPAGFSAKDGFLQVVYKKAK